MEDNHDIFAAKLAEMEADFSRMRDRMRGCDQLNHRQLRAEKIRLINEWQAAETLWRERIRETKLSVARDLAEAQLVYCERVENILDEAHQKKHQWDDTENSPADYAGLYAEYAIDCASLAMRHALLAVLCAIDLQLSEDEAAEKESMNE